MQVVAITEKELTDDIDIAGAVGYRVDAGRSGCALFIWRSSGRKQTRRNIMGDVAYSLDAEPAKGVEVVIHVDETLSEERRGKLSEELTSVEGIHAADFCPLRFHLMVLTYDRERMNSQEVLTTITSKGVHAKLIGPV